MKILKFLLLHFKLVGNLLLILLSAFTFNKYSSDSKIHSKSDIKIALKRMFKEIF